MSRIFLDHHSTTPCDPRVVDAMLPWFTDKPGNPASPHLFGWEAKEAVHEAQNQLASLLGCAPTEVVFTSGATESNNLALQGLMREAGKERRHLVGSSLEHPSVLDTAHILETEGHDLTVLEPRDGGIVHPDDLRAYILGEHGDTQLPVFTMAVAGGTRIAEDEATHDIFRQASRSGYDVVHRKGHTNFAISMAATLVVLVAFVAPSALDGNDPLLVAVVAASAIAFISLYLTHGFTPTTTVALAGTLAALGLTLGLSWTFFELAQFSGFATEESPGTTKFDTSARGNSNSGHDTYGDFNDDERWQLVEYMKSL